MRSAAINPLLQLLVEKRPGVSPRKSNMIYYSEFREGYSKDTFSNLGIKYVAEGTEYYKIGGTEYKVNEKHFLIAGKTPGTPGYIDSKKPVKGICIDINPTTVADAFNVLSSKEKPDPDHNAESESELPYFFEHISFVGTSSLNHRLQNLEKHLIAHDFQIPFVDDEWFLETAEELICEQHEKWKVYLERLEFLKNSTKKEIIRRLLIGKEYMDLHFYQSPDIKTIAKYSCLSEFHFYRSFKDAFCITPYQYILKKKLEFAFELLTVKKLGASEIASQLNFTDLQAFSNAFKKRFGSAPSKFIG